MGERVRVGVIGLGRRWRRRYRAALRGMADRFQVAAVCDVAAHRAVAEAWRLACGAAAGPTERLEGHGIAAVLLLAAPWYGLWPLEALCRFGKPVLCAAPLDRDDAHADALVRQVRERGLPVLTEMLPRAAPAPGGLRHLLENHLAPPRLLVCALPPPVPGTGRGARLPLLPTPSAPPAVS